MADKIEYSRMLVKRTDQTGEVPTVPPITAVTLNQFIPTDLFVGEFFLNEVDDLLWVRTANGILPISLSGSTGTTTTPTLTQVLFEGNVTNGYNIDVSVGDTIIFQGLNTGSTTNFLGLDASGNTIVSGVVPGTPTLQDVLFQGNQTNGTDIEVSSGDTIVFNGLTTGSTTNILGIDNSGNTIVTSGTSGGGDTLWTSGVTEGSITSVGGGNTNELRYTLMFGTGNTTNNNATDLGNIIVGRNNNVQSSSYSNIFGRNHNVTGSDYSGIFGFGHTITNGGLYDLVFGSTNTLNNTAQVFVGGGLNSVTAATQSFILGNSNNMGLVVNSSVFGTGNTCNATQSFIFGRSNFDNSGGSNLGNFIVGDGNTGDTLSRSSVILGGLNNYITTVDGNSNSGRSSIIGGRYNRLSANRSTILGGQYITGTTDDMVYVPNLTIVSATTGTSIASLGIDSTGKVIKTDGGVGLFLPLSGGTVTGDTTFTQDFYLTNLTSGGSQTFLTVDSDTGQVYTGSLNPFVGNIQIQGQSWVNLPATGNTTSATTINWNDGNVQEKVLNVSSTTFTFSNPNAGGTYILILRQRSSGGGTITWPGTVSWAGGTPPTMTTTANKYDVYTFVYDGNKYFGSYVQDFT